MSPSLLLLLFDPFWVEFAEPFELWRVGQRGGSEKGKGKGKNKTTELACLSTSGRAPSDRVLPRQMKEWIDDRHPRHKRIV